MAAKRCGACGAGFEGEGATDALAEHVEGFHPPSPFVEKAKAVTGGASIDKEARAAIKALGDAFGELADRTTALEELPGRVEALESAATAPDEGGSAEPAEEPAPDDAGEAGAPPAG